MSDTSDTSDTSHAGRHTDAAASGAGEERFLAALRRVFDTLRAAPPVVARLDARLADVAADLVRRARRRRARFDLVLREAPPEHGTDLALALRAQQGSEAALVEIRRRLEPVVLKRIYAYGLGWNEADLLELVFARVWDKLPTFRGQASLRTWGATLSANALKNWMRANDAKPEHVPLETTTGAAHAGAAGELAGDWTADGDVITHEREDQIRQMARALASIAREVLKPDDWELLQQQIVEGRSYAELGGASGRSEVALRKRRFDALRKLRAAVVERFGARFADDVHETLARP